MSSVFKIYSPEDCDFYYDGELQGHIEGNSDRAFRFEVERKGIYRLKFVNSEYKSELIVKVSIDADEEQEVELDFREVNEPVIRERERIIIAIEQDYGFGERLPDDIISAISNNGVITIPKGVRKIGNSAFRGCSLTSITIPDGVKKIGVCAFSGCRCLTHIAIPDSVKEIGEDVFFGCRSLTSVYCKATTPQKLEGRIFYDNASDLKIYVPKSDDSTILEAYKSAEGWELYADIIKEYDFDNE